jgi:hypothetical protein
LQRYVVMRLPANAVVAQASVIATSSC